MRSSSGAGGYQMIHGVAITNFRGFESASLDDCRRVNVVVGENASGKTALLEGLFLAGASSPEAAARLRQWRGFEGAFAGTPDQIQRALWGDLFFGRTVDRVAEISLRGDDGETRSVKLSPADSTVLLDLSSDSPSVPQSITSPVTFTWRGPFGREYEDTPLISPGGQLAFRAGPAPLLDTAMFTPAGTFSAPEAAWRFSEMSKASATADVVAVFTEQFPMVIDLSIEILAGQPLIFATLRDGRGKVPVNSLSSGVNKFLGILLAISSFKRGAVLVDEIENGFYFKRMPMIWKAILDMAEMSDAQVFASTHSRECLEALIEAAGDDVSAISLIKARRVDDRSTLRQFTGATLKAGLEHDEEVR